GLWEAIPPLRLVLLTLVCTLFLALVLGLVEFLGRRVGLAREDRITLLFGGSKKSMATGIPMAQVLFVGGAVGPLILPLMIFHQIQLMVCAALAQRMARPAADPAPADEPVGLGRPAFAMPPTPDTVYKNSIRSEHARHPAAPRSRPRLQPGHPLRANAQRGLARRRVPGGARESGH